MKHYTKGVLNGRKVAQFREQLRSYNSSTMRERIRFKSNNPNVWKWMNEVENFSYKNEEEGC